MRTLYCICVAKFWQQWGYRGGFLKLPPCLRESMAPGTNILPLAKAEPSRGGTSGIMCLGRGKFTVQKHLQPERGVRMSERNSPADTGHCRKRGRRCSRCQADYLGGGIISAAHGEQISTCNATLEHSAHEGLSPVEGTHTRGVLFPQRKEWQDQCVMN